MESMTSLIDKFKDLWYGDTKQDIEGYTIMADIKNNRTLIMVKEGEKSWKTKWFNNSKYNFTVPNQPISTLFMNN
jgi:hypothetical protein